MSDGTLNLPKRSTAPDSPAANRYKIYVDASDGEVKYKDDLGVVRTFKGDTGDNGVDGDTGPQGIQGIQGDQGIQGPAGPMTVEGTVFKTTTVTLPNTTTKTLVYSDIINHSTSGDCFLMLSLAIRGHAPSNDMEFDFTYDGVLLVPEQIEEHKDSSAKQSNMRSFTFDIGNQTAGNKTIELNFSKESTGGTAQVKAYTVIVVRYS